MRLRSGISRGRTARPVEAGPVAFFVAAALMVGLGLAVAGMVFLSGCGRRAAQPVPAEPTLGHGLAAEPASEPEEEPAAAPATVPAIARTVDADGLEAAINLALARAGVDPLTAKRLDKLEAVTVQAGSPGKTGKVREYTWERRWQTFFAMPTPAGAGVTDYVEIIKRAAAEAGGGVFTEETRAEDGGVLLEVGFDSGDGQRFLTHVILVLATEKLAGAEAWNHEKAEPFPSLTVPSQKTPSQPSSTQPMPPAMPPAGGSSPTAGGEAYISIIIDDWGYNLGIGRKFLELAQPLTMAVIPFTPHAEGLLAEGKARGWEALLHLPMEPVSSFWELGPGSIKTSLGADDIRRRVEEDLAALPGVDGVNNHMGSKATADERVMDAVMDVVSEKGLFFIDSRTSARSVAEKVAATYGVEHAGNQVFLDNVDSVDAVAQRIRLLAQTARRSGTALGIGHVRANTAAALARMLPELEAEGVSVIPVKELLALRQTPKRIFSVGDFE